jgi:hypothetical protein
MYMSVDVQQALPVMAFDPARRQDVVWGGQPGVE